MHSMKFHGLVTEKVIRLGYKNRKAIDFRDKDLDVLVEVLQKSDVLEELHLYGNRLTLADGKFTHALANNNTLRWLFLNDNKIGIEGAKRLADALKVNKTLKKLYLGANKIGDEGAKLIANALMENESLEEFSLDRNNIGDEGAKSLADCFMVNRSIHEVNLNHNIITDDGAQQLIKALKLNYGIESFDIWRNPISKHLKAEINTLMKDPERKPPLIKRLREENTTLKAALASAEAKLKSIQDEKKATGTSLNDDTRNVKVKQEDIDTDDGEMGSPEKKKQKTEKA